MENEQEQSTKKVNHGNTRLPFGLCKRYNISLPEGATPRDAWNALEGKGITPRAVWKKLKKRKIKNSDDQKDESVSSDNFIDNSRYKKNHEEIVSFVKEQTGVDLNKYRDNNGDPETPNNTQFWDKNKSKYIAVIKMSREDQYRVNDLLKKGLIRQEPGGAWFDFISLEKRGTTPTR